MKQLFHFIGATVLIFGLLGCKRPPSNILQGYVEGEFVDIFFWARPSDLLRP